MSAFKRAFVCIFLFLVVAPLSEAQGDKDEIIDKVIEAYGAENFINMKSLVISSRYKGFRFGQSNSPDAVDEELYNARITIDFDENRKSFQWIIGRPSSFSIQHQVFDGESGFRLDHTNRTIAENNAINFASADRQVSYFIDTVLLKLLITVRDNATYLGKENYRGKLHDKISFQAPGHPTLTLYIDEMTSRVNYMTRPHWSQGQFSYQFNDHRFVDGILVAQDTYVTRGGQPFNVMLSREVTVNPYIDEDFVLPTNYTQEGEALDFSEMSVAKLAEGVFLAGQDWGFSIFIDAGDYLIASGGYAGLKERYEAMKRYSKLEKPIKYQVVSHHHLDHLGGMQEAADLGVTYVTVAEHVESIRAITAQDLDDNRFLLINGSGRLAGGVVEILDFPNGHADHHLITFVPSIKTVFTADMFLSRQKSGAPPGYEDLKELRNAIQTAGMDAKHYAAAHSGRVLTTDDLNSAIANIETAICPDSWTQCAEYRWND